MVGWKSSLPSVTGFSMSASEQYLILLDSQAMKSRFIGYGSALILPLIYVSFISFELLTGFHWALPTWLALTISMIFSRFDLFGPDFSDWYWMILVFTKFWLSISPSRVKRRSRADLQKSEAEEWKTKKKWKKRPSLRPRYAILHFDSILHSQLTEEQTTRPRCVCVCEVVFWWCGASDSPPATTTTTTATTTTTRRVTKARKVGAPEVAASTAARQITRIRESKRERQKENSPGWCVCIITDDGRRNYRLLLSVCVCGGNGNGSGNGGVGGGWRGGDDGAVEVPPPRRRRRRTTTTTTRTRGKNRNRRRRRSKTRRPGRRKSRKWKRRNENNNNGGGGGGGGGGDSGDDGHGEHAADEIKSQINHNNARNNRLAHRKSELTEKSTIALATRLPFLSSPPPPILTICLFSVCVCVCVCVCVPLSFPASNCRRCHNCDFNVQLPPPLPHPPSVSQRSTNDRWRGNGEKKMGEKKIYKTQ